MGMRASQGWVKRVLNKQAKRFPGVEFRAVYASNGETAVLPVDPTTGEVSIDNPQKFVVKNLWNKMCKHDGNDPQSMFVEFSKSNPYAAEYNEEMAKLQAGR